MIFQSSISRHTKPITPLLYTRYISVPVHRKPSKWHSGLPEHSLSLALDRHGQCSRPFSPNCWVGKSSVDTVTAERGLSDRPMCAESADPCQNWDPRSTRDWVFQIVWSESTRAARVAARALSSSLLSWFAHDNREANHPKKPGPPLAWRLHIQHPNSQEISHAASLTKPKTNAP